MRQLRTVTGTGAEREATVAAIAEHLDPDASATLRQAYGLSEAE